MDDVQLGKYLSLHEFCTCTNTYRHYADKINPFPQNSAATIQAIKDLNDFIIDPVIDCFGKDRFQLTYGFCSADLKKYLEKKDPITGIKNGRVAPKIDQHIAYELNKNGQYYCPRLGAACDFFIRDLSSNELVEWIISQRLPFDSLYFYGEDRPIHISYGPQHKGDIWTFTAIGTPTKKGIEHWVKAKAQLSSGFDRDYSQV
ncbi:hypothetical protein PN499_07330 [Kamptonema animale CS-326]|jgi:hypothetical protein|uniref:hypothetical protein n=1 Tax=Kamptonema animale TaxID=92934 RepID=UPI002330777D|nr:hypothetical protein [Kamptonema animale]MDB9510990.1 hypothetical protein [Kamptonema animale CS-326]